MTDDDIEIFLTLKFTGMKDVLNSFKNAVGVPTWAITNGVNLDGVEAALRIWVEAGAPKEYEIPLEHAETFLVFKFGSVDKAYDYVVSRPPGESHGLSENEIAVVMDYVKPPKE